MSELKPGTLVTVTYLVRMTQKIELVTEDFLDPAKDPVTAALEDEGMMYDTAEIVEIESVGL